MDEGRLRVKKITLLIICGSPIGNILSCGFFKRTGILCRKSLQVYRKKCVIIVSVSATSMAKQRVLWAYGKRGSLHKNYGYPTEDTFWATHYIPHRFRPSDCSAPHPHSPPPHPPSPTHLTPSPTLMHPSTLWLISMLGLPAEILQGPQIACSVRVISDIAWTLTYATPG